MGKLTTHVLDTHAGIPAAGVRIELRQLLPSETRLLGTCVTGENGRCADALLQGEFLHPGQYELAFHVGEYFRGRGVALCEPAFFEEAIVRLGIAHAEQHYHVPLLMTPWSYCVYRGG